MSVVGTSARQQLDAQWAECLRDARSSDPRARYLAVGRAGQLLVATLRGRGCPRRGLFSSVDWAIKGGLLTDERRWREACWARDEILDGDSGSPDRCAEAVERLRTVQASIGSVVPVSRSQPQQPRRTEPPPPRTRGAEVPGRQAEPQVLQLEAVSDIHPPPIEEGSHVNLIVRSLGAGRRLVPNVDVTFDIKQKPAADGRPNLDRTGRPSVMKRTHEDGSAEVEFRGRYPGDYAVVAWTGNLQVEFRITVQPKRQPDILVIDV